MLATNNFNVRGCDISPSSLETAARESVKWGLDIPLATKSIYELDPQTDAADTVLCCEVLEHLTNPGAGLEKLLSITRKDFPFFVIYLYHSFLLTISNLTRSIDAKEPPNL